MKNIIRHKKFTQDEIRERHGLNETKTAAIFKRSYDTWVRAKKQTQKDLDTLETIYNMAYGDAIQDIITSFELGDIKKENIFEFK